MLTWRNGIYIETELARRGGMVGAPDEHAEVSGNADLGLFCPLARSMKIFASYPKIMIIDIAEMPYYQTGISETYDLHLFLEVKVQPLDSDSTKHENLEAQHLVRNDIIMTS